MTPIAVVMTVLAVLLALATGALLAWCVRLSGMATRLARQSARMRRRAIRAEGRVLILTRAIEDYAARMDQASQLAATRSAGAVPTTLVLRPSSGANLMYVTPHGEDIGAE